MNSVLDNAVAEVVAGIKGLRAVIISAAPDGLIAWSWAADGEHDIALGFADLDRAATACLANLDASQQSRSLLLTAKDRWVTSWPLFEFDSDDRGGPEPERLVVTTVFGGELQSGMVMVYGTRVRAHLRKVVQHVRNKEASATRRELARYLGEAVDACEALSELSNDLDIDVRRFGCIEQMRAEERARLMTRLGKSQRTRPRLLQ